MGSERAKAERGERFGDRPSLLTGHPEGAPLSSLIHGLLGAFFPPAPEPLEEVEIGRVAVVRGRVVPRDLMKSPLTGTSCVYYRSVVERWRAAAVAGRAWGDGFWEVADRDEAIVEFYLEDGDRRAVVSPFDARVETRRGVGVRDVALGGWTAGRAQELLLVAGDWIEVVGLVDRVDDLFDDGRDYRGSATRLCLRAPEGQPLVVRLLQNSRTWQAGIRADK